MKLTVKIRKAINIAASQHSGQKRKGVKLPYIIHPFSVALILSEYTDDEDVICAGLLHDVLEDAQDYTYENLQVDFGPKVAKIVYQVSEAKEWLKDNFDKAGTWRQRKKLYLKMLQRASLEALMVSAADKIHNLLSMQEAYYLLGDSLWESFNASREDKFWFYQEVLNVIKKRLSNPIVNELGKILSQTINQAYSSDH